MMPFVEGMAFDALIESHMAKNRSFDEAGLHGLLTRMLDALSYYIGFRIARSSVP
ncbi:MAG: hypothetical protein WCO57_05620 [Verrucomicrobiota bacterium]